MTRLTMDYQGLRERYGMPKKKKGQKAKISVSKGKKKKKGISTKPKRPKPLTSEKRQQIHDEDVKTYDWWKVAKSIKNRDKRCLLCGKKENLQVHHLWYDDYRYKNGKWNIRRLWQYPPEVLITLCDECHEKVHNNQTHKYNPLNNKPNPKYI